MDYHHLTVFERIRIAVLSHARFSARKIAEEIGRHHSKISRKLKRNLTNDYQAETIQKQYINRRLLSKPKGKFSPHLAQKIEKALAHTWSPEQISNAYEGKTFF